MSHLASCLLTVVCSYDYYPHTILISYDCSIRIINCSVNSMAVLLEYINHQSFCSNFSMLKKLTAVYTSSIITV